MLERYAPWQGLAAMYLVAAGWRGGADGHNHRMTYVAAEDRYDQMPYRRCGRSGIKLPAISLGLWNRFGDDTPIANQRAIIRRAFDLGITHIDLANNYGPPYGSSEINFGRIMREDLAPYRDELIISTKAGYDMWPGPYGEWGSRKYLLSSLDQSLGRMGLEYVDIFYSHRFDPDTPLEETIGALDTAVRSGQGALRRHLLLLRRAHRGGGRDRPRPGHADPDPPAVLLAAEPLDRARGAGRLRRGGLGIIAFSPLGQGMLTDRYLGGIPEDSRAAKDFYLKKDFINEENMARVTRAQRDRAAAAARRSRRWRSPGSCATRA